MVVVTVVQVFSLGVLIFGIGMSMKVRRKTLAAVAMAVMFYNSGNYGLPLAELAFPAHGMGDGISPLIAAPSEAGAHHDGGAVQAFVVMAQSLLTFTVGMFIATYAGGTSPGAGVTKILRLPNVWTLLAGLIVNWWLRHDAARHLPVMISATTGYLSAAMVPSHC